MAYPAFRPDGVVSTADAGPRTMAADRATVAALARAAGSSFFWAMRLLPAAKRNAMFGVYAFCREVDDIADAHGLASAERLRRLAHWQAEIGAIYCGRPTTAIGRVLQAPVHGLGLEQAEFEAIIDGMRMDAEAAIQAPPQDLLELYCRRVAVATGRLSVVIFGEPGDAGRAVADHLGRAFQLTNILRDLDEDAAIGRLYLPRELLASHGIACREPTAVVAHPALHRACLELAQEAARSFAAADEALRACDPRSMRPAVVMRQVYGRLLDGLLARGWVDRRRDPAPGRATKLWLALRHGIF